MTGEIIAESEVAIRKGGSLGGDVTARSISVEKGGMFSGQLVIGQGALMQGRVATGRRTCCAFSKGGNSGDGDAAFARCFLKYGRQDAKAAAA